MRFSPGLWLSRLVVGLSLAATSCTLFQALMPDPVAKPRPFNHEAHTVRGIGCVDCHEGGDAKDVVHVPMPTKTFCMTCHEDLDKDKDKPVEKKVAWFLDEKGDPRWATFGKQTADIKFSHAPHAAGKVDCLACHAGMDKNIGLLPKGGLQRMTACIACHQEKATTKLECSTCHQSIDRQHAPPNHQQLWTKTHGKCSRDGAQVATGNDCAMCHQQNACATCHNTVAPDDHTTFWRLRAHGVTSGLDRSRCSTCHQTDFCVRCHSTTAPVSHGAGWNAPRDNHCVNCHQPLATSQGCAVCHRDTPGHLSAPPKPVWHTAGMICLSCHAATMKHPNNGDNCNSCHR
jgi:predicted CXXCH cytochrome family protein